MICRRISGSLGLFVFLTLSACDTRAARKAAATDHVMILVFDQMRPDYIDRFGLQNFKHQTSHARNSGGFSLRFLWQFLPSRIRDKFGGKIFAVGEKNYATELRSVEPLH